jgi:modification methylase
LQRSQLTKMDNDSTRFDTIYHGDCREVMKKFPEKSVDLVFADPPYNLQLDKVLWRPNSTKVNGVEENWDQFSTFEAYDQFTLSWLSEVRRLLKDTGTIWVIGSYHNIFRVGKILQDLGFWILNDVIWVKNNPMPNFHGVRFTNAHETLIWAQKSKGKQYTFNYHAMKTINYSKNHDGKVQMRSDWNIPICTGKERLRINGEKAHPTQKPEALLERVILSSTNPGDIILDPFFGSGTTGAMAKKLQRHWIGIEADECYVSIAKQRIDAVNPETVVSVNQSDAQKHRQKRIPFSAIIQKGYLKEGQILFFGKKGREKARIVENGQIRYGEKYGSIHSIGREILNAPCNGWMAWYYIDDQSGARLPIDHLRKLMREEIKQNQKDSPDTSNQQ